MNQVGRYQIVEELGRGAMGVVYRALDPAIGRTIAIKSIRLGDFVDPDERRRVRERLLREAQAAGVLSHPNIITIYDVLEEENFAYIFMEYVHGASLEKMLQKRTLPGPPALLQIFRQVADALDYAHRKGIIHRDIKPANIIVPQDGTSGNALAKIADFGVAKVLSLEVTHTGTMIGTPTYMSPEQIQGLTVDGRSDQFSLAVIIYEVLCGEKPFVADALPTLFYLVVKEDPKPVHQVNPLLSETVTKVMRRALSKEPGDRFPTCSDFIGALTIALGDCSEWTAPATSAAVREQYQAKAAMALAGTERPFPSETATRLKGIVASTPVMTDPEPPGGAGIPAPANLPIVPELPSLHRRRPSEWDLDAPEEGRHRNPFTTRLALFIALLFAIGAAIVFIVRLNSGGPAPVQVLDSNSGPATPPPDTSGPNAVPRAPDKPPVPSPAETKQAATANTESKQQSPAAAPRTGQNEAERTNGVADIELLSEPPGAKLVVDNRPELTCTTPCSMSLSNGRHTLTAELKGYGVARRIFTVPSDTNLFINLSRETGVLLVTSEPSGADVIVDGKNYGKTPQTLHLDPGTHRLVLMNGSSRHEETVEIEPDGFQARGFRWQ